MPKRGGVVTWGSERDLMPPPSNSTGHLWSELHLIKLDLREHQVHRGHAERRMDGFAKELERLDAAIEEINSRINGAILWLALGAGGLILQIVGPKLGL